MIVWYLVKTKIFENAKFLENIFYRINKEQQKPDYQ